MLREASATDQKQGMARSQKPVGRSARAKRKYGRNAAGARRSTRFAARASATLPVLPSATERGICSGLVISFCAHLDRDKSTDARKAAAALRQIPAYPPRKRRA